MDPPQVIVLDDDDDDVSLNNVSKGESILVDLDDDNFGGLCGGNERGL